MARHHRTPHDRLMHERRTFKYGLIGFGVYVIIFIWLAYGAFLGEAASN